MSSLLALFLDVLIMQQVEIDVTPLPPHDMPHSSLPGWIELLSHVARLQRHHSSLLVNNSTHRHSSLLVNNPSSHLVNNSTRRHSSPLVNSPWSRLFNSHFWSTSLLFQDCPFIMNVSNIQTFISTPKFIDDDN